MKSPCFAPEFVSRNFVLLNFAHVCHKIIFLNGFAQFTRYPRIHNWRDDHECTQPTSTQCVQFMLYKSIEWKRSRGESTPANETLDQVKII